MESTDANLCKHPPLLISAMRALVLSDIHGNLAALETVLERTRGEYDELWCLGDIVGYGPKPDECVALIMERAAFCVPGNHDLAVLGKLDTAHFNDMARQAILWTRSVLSPAHSNYLTQLDPVPVRKPELELMATHGSPRDPVSEYLSDLCVAKENWQLFSEKFCLVGHTHLPDIFRLWLRPAPPRAKTAQVALVEQLRAVPGQEVQLQPQAEHRVILNPGSVGQPRDKNYRAAYAILDTEHMIWGYDRTDYPVELTQGQMREARLPQVLIDRLSYGW